MAKINYKHSGKLYVVRYPYVIFKFLIVIILLLFLFVLTSVIIFKSFMTQRELHAGVQLPRQPETYYRARANS